jgi:hypothetical protein
VTCTYRSQGNCLDRHQGGHGSMWRGSTTLEGSGGEAREDIQLLESCAPSRADQFGRLAVDLHVLQRQVGALVAGLQGNPTICVYQNSHDFQCCSQSDSCVVSPGEQQLALERAIPDRVAVMQNFEHDDANDPTSAEELANSQNLLCYRLSHCQDGFSRGKSTLDSRQEKHDLARKRKREDDSTVSAPVKFSRRYSSINWQLLDRQTRSRTDGRCLVVSAMEKPKSSQDYHALGRGCVGASWSIGAREWLATTLMSNGRMLNGRCSWL